MEKTMVLKPKYWFVTCAVTSLIGTSGSAFALDDFLPYTTTETGSRPEAVAIGDINNDGRNDVVLTTSYNSDPDNDYKVFVFTQNDDGTLSEPVKYATSGGYVNSPVTVNIADVNNDGLNDIIVGEKGKGIEVFYQNSTGDLSTGMVISTPFSLRIRTGDLNGDGLIDVAGIGWGGQEVGVFLQDDSGVLSFSDAYYAPHGGYDDLELGDVNNDGLTDIVVMSGQSYS
jgi:hypothetical protein